jgi:hypothetical protein
VGCVGKIFLCHHVAVLNVEFSNLLIIPTALAFFTAAVIWIYYMALEPYVRRSWPEYLISWTRLLAGHYRDPMVGRDLLAGCLLGSLMALVEHVVNALPAWFNLAGQTPINGDGPVLGTTLNFAGTMLQAFIGPVFIALTMLFLFFLIRTVARSYWVSIVALGVLIAAMNLGQENVIAESMGAIVLAVLVLTALRFGLLTLIAAYTTQNLLQGFPVALDPSRWYFARGFVPVLIVLAFALYGFRVSLGSRPVFAGWTTDD